MKLSNKILIGFFGLIFIYLTAAFTEIRLRGKHNRFNTQDNLSEKIELTQIKYLVLSDLRRNIKVIGADHSGIELESIKGDFLKHLKYQIKGDTLWLKRLDSANRELVNLIVYVPSSIFEGMTNNGGSVSIRSIEQKLLTITQNDGWINLIDCKLERLELTASHEANFNMSNAILDTLSAQIDNTEVNIDNALRLVRVSMTNNSYLSVDETEDIQIKTDKSSRFNLY